MLVTDNLGATGSDVSYVFVGLRGDVNADGGGDLSDLMITIRTLTSSTEMIKINGDVDNELKIGLPEAIYIINELGND